MEAGAGRLNLPSGVLTWQVERVAMPGITALSSLIE